jgi:hypothetical protein
MRLLFFGLLFLLLRDNRFLICHSERPRRNEVTKLESRNP